MLELVPLVVPVVEDEEVDGIGTVNEAERFKRPFGRYRSGCAVAHTSNTKSDNDRAWRTPSSGMRK